MWRRACLLVLTLLAFHTSAQACISLQPIDLSHVREADAVVIGRVSNYAFVLDPVIRQQFAKNPSESSPEHLENLPDRPRFITDYARFDLQIDETLVGSAGSKIAVILYGSWIMPPKSLPPGPFLIALQSPGSSSPEPAAFRALQGPCSNPFVFSSTSDEARKIREILRPKNIP